MHVVVDNEVKLTFGQKTPALHGTESATIPSSVKPRRQQDCEALPSSKQNHETFLLTSLFSVCDTCVQRASDRDMLLRPIFNERMRLRTQGRLWDRFSFRDVKLLSRNSTGRAANC